MTGLSHVDGFKLFIQVCEGLGFPQLRNEVKEFLRLFLSIRIDLTFHVPFLTKYCWNMQ